MSKRSENTYIQKLLGQHKICPGVRLFAMLAKSTGKTFSASEIEATGQVEGRIILANRAWWYYNFAYALTYTPIFALALWMLNADIPVWAWAGLFAVGLIWVSLSQRFWGWTEIQKNPQELLDLVGETGLYALENIDKDKFYCRVGKLDLAVVFLSNQYAAAQTADRLAKIAKMSRKRNNVSDEIQKKDNRRVM